MGRGLGSDRVVKKAYMVLGLAVLAGLGSCAGGGGGAEPRTREGSEPPVAVIAGRAVSRAMLQDALAEGYAGPVIEDLALDLMLEKELALAGVTIGVEDLERERAAFLAAIGGDDAPRVMQEVLGARGLGPRRFDALLRRNAGLRALVRGRVEVTDEMVRRLYAVREGERLQARIITTRRAEEAAALRASLLQLDGEARRIGFAATAMERSTDASGPAGGLLEAISPEDPSYSLSVRKSLAAMEPRHISEVIAVEGGYAIFYLEQRRPGRARTFETVRDELAGELRARQERLLMDELAITLLAKSEIAVLDPALRWGWERFSARSR